MRVLKESFNAGEFTPRLDARSEIAKYKNGCKTLTNMVPLAHGPTTRRPGTEYIASVKTATSYTRLIPFVFSEEDSYVLEFGDSYIRFFHNGGQIQTPDANTLLLLHMEGSSYSKTITDDGATDHSANITANGSAFLTGTFGKIGSSSCRISDVAGSYVSVADHADFDFDSGDFTIDFWIRLSSVTKDCGIFQQFADANNHVSFYWDYTAGALKLFGDLAGVTQFDHSWTWAPATGTWYHVAIIRGWGGVTNDWAVTINGAEIGTTSTDASDYPNIAAPFDIGRSYKSDGTTLVYAGKWIDEFRVSDTARWTTTFAPPTSAYPAGDSSGVVYEIVSTYAQEDLYYLQFVQSADTMYIVHENYVVRKLVRTNHDSWAISNVTFTNAPAAWSAADYPRTIEFHEDRLCFGGSPDQPDTFWTSDTGDYAVFSGTAADDEAITLTLGARRVNNIQWMSSGRKLVMGTTGEEWWVAGPSDTEPMTPTSNVARRDSAWGSGRIMPENIGDVIFYVQRGEKSIREMVYDFGKDKYISTDLNILAEHLTRTYKITSMAFQQHPYQVLWCIRGDGTLLALTYLKEHDVIGWATHTSSSGEFEDVVVIPGSLDDEVWFAVKRTVNSTEVRYIEKLKNFNFGTALEDAFFVDSGLTYDGAAATVISGLSHLEGEAVVVLADGAVITGHTVASGAITLSAAASKVHIGLAYTPVVETLDVVREDDEGPLQGNIGRIENVSIKLVGSQGGQVGPDSSKLDDIPYDSTTSPYTGWTDDISFDEGFDKTSTVYITSDEPLPLEVAAINMDLED